jgi:MFS family permease
MIVVACLSSFAVRMAMPFLVVYAVEVVGLTTTEWGLIQTAVGLLSAGLSMPGGMLSDRIGRKPLILGSRVISPVTMLGLTFTSSFTHVLLVRAVGAVGAGLGGGIWGMMGGPAWQALVADMIPSSRRGRVMGFMATITGVAGVPSSWLGGYLWDNHAPEYPFWVSFIVGIIPVAIFYVFVKEPKQREV